MAGRLRGLWSPLVAIALAGCTVGPDYHPPELRVDEAWLGPFSGGAIDATWWRRLEDPLLSELVEEAIAGNKDLQEAAARLREARAYRDAAHGRELPQVAASAVVTQNRLSENGLLPVGKVPGLGRDLAIFDGGFDASWELDLWGGTERGIESAEARAQAAEEARRGVLIQVIGEVVRSYLDMRAAQKLREISLSDAKAQDGIARLVSERVRVGLASRGDLVRAETQAHATAATVPLLDADAAAAAFRLALLLGRPPEALQYRLRRPGRLPAGGLEIAAGLRSDLLRRRPDIRRAERELAASTAEIGVATAELFPRISLLGGIGLQARNSGDLVSGSSLRFQVGPSLRWPIFSGGRIRAQIRAADARSDAALVRYERTVLEALSDSETAINRYVAAGRARSEREAAHAAAGEAVELARRRYGAGEEDLTALLQTQVAFSSADRQRVQAHVAELMQFAAVYKALGGGWESADGLKMR
ncbi:efflux transporter outer membrane subunit [Sphingosinicella sp. BN140058]|nr:efflux transporter outer membrane subunit [Sphingosinicella sp. BN140058]